MFTGLIEETGIVRRLDRKSRGMEMSVSCGFPPDDPKIGDSVACDGVCLTVTELQVGGFTAHVGPETIDRTTLTDFRPGTEINLERALKVGDRLGGHLVAGHVDCPARLTSKDRRGEAWDLFYVLETPDLLRYLIEKGSVCVDGVSLTVNGKRDNGFLVTVIPHTAQKTTLFKKRIGDRVNIETDMLGKYVESILSGGSSSPVRGGSKLGMLLGAGSAPTRR